MNGSHGDDPVYYYFGFRSDDLQSVAEEIAGLLDIEWKPRNGDAHGGDYYVFREGNSRSGVLQNNHAEFMSWIAPNYSHYPLILSIYWYERASAPASTDLLQKFSSIFADVIFIPQHKRGQLTPLKMLKIEPLGIFAWLFYAITMLFNKKIEL